MKNTEIRPCKCVAVLIILAKSAGAKINDRPRTEVPWFNRTNGAEFQDRTYGPGNRIHNMGSSGNKGKEITATCTVCGERKKI